MVFSFNTVGPYMIITTIAATASSAGITERRSLLCTGESLMADLIPGQLSSHGTRRMLQKLPARSLLSALAAMTDSSSSSDSPDRAPSAHAAASRSNCSSVSSAGLRNRLLPDGILSSGGVSRGESISSVIAIRMSLQDSFSEPHVP